MDQNEHDENLRRFRDVADKHQLIFNKDKCVYSVESVDLLGYTISQGVLRPDPDRMKPLRKLPVPHSPKSVKRAMGRFSYYSQWIPRFSDKIKPLANATSFPLDSNAYCSSSSSDSLYELHSALCHLGINRLLHFVRSKNLPFSVDDVKRTIKQCQICAKVKPQYAKPNASPLVKATQPFERLSIDFKGPLPSVSTKKYILTVVDEYSRFPFAFPCSDMTSATVIQCLRQLFDLFGMPWTAVNLSPQSNGQCERYNGIIWKAVTLALESLGLKETQWESVLPDALHSVRSLLCTSINCTPHERFFNFTRRSSSGQSIPSWLANPGPILMKKHVRATKYDPLVEEVDLLEANPTYAHVRLPDGRETTVSVRHLAPRGQSISNDNLDHSVLNDNRTMDIAETDVENTTQEATNNTDNTMETSPVIRRSTREIKKPCRFGFDDQLFC
ncbi:unnamed protein product [Mytilus edulis]|uniref:Integrase catalytic domain-containing protein n=1 Tax=Mytilus edulis TaxID=6550 RepID=A0A8S3R8S2_MYTED|nr:unnamed protein product [Mytilus edulis]